MSNHKFFAMSVLATLLVAGCAGTTPTAIIAPAMTNVPTAASTAAAVLASGSTISPIAPAASHDLISAGQINDAIQARLRLAHLVARGPNVDLIVNGAVAINGGQAQANIPAGDVNGYLFLSQGTYRIAVVPTGQGLAQALIGPLDVPLAAGHRYTLAMMGQITDKSLKPLIIDETAAARKVGAMATDSVRIWVDNLAGGSSIGVHLSEYPGDIQVAYGAFATAVYPAGNNWFAVNLVRDTPAYQSYDRTANEPGANDLIASVGAWPHNPGWVAAPPTSELNIMDFLKGFSSKNNLMEDPISFHILLAAIKAAGLTDMLITGGPYLLLAPTDAAFERLPAQQRAALLADPRALADLLRNHLVAAYVPKGALAKTAGGVADRSFTNLLGVKLTIGGGFTVNGASVGNYSSTFVANGTQIHPINRVLLP